MRSRGTRIGCDVRECMAPGSPCCQADKQHPQVQQHALQTPEGSAACYPTSCPTLHLLNDQCIHHLCLHLMKPELLLPLPERASRLAGEAEGVSHSHQQTRRPGFLSKVPANRVLDFCRISHCSMGFGLGYILPAMGSRQPARPTPARTSLSNWHSFLILRACSS